MAVTLADLEAARAGDYVAGQLLLREVYQPVYHFIRKRVGNKEVSEELCQTVFLKVYEKLSSFSEAKASVLTWVFAITRHTLIDYYRREKPMYLSDAQSGALADDKNFADTSAKEREEEQHVARLLALLPIEQADVVTLRAIDEMSYEQIALIIGKSPEATRQIYSRAITRLRQLVASAEVL